MAHENGGFIQGDPAAQTPAPVFKRILFIFSARENVEGAFAEAMPIAETHSAGLEIVAMVGLAEASDPAANDPLHDGSAFRTLARLVSLAREKGLKANSRILLAHSRILDEIIAEARRIEADLIILGPISDPQIEHPEELEQKIREQTRCPVLTTG